MLFGQLAPENLSVSPVVNVYLFQTMEGSGSKRRRMGLTFYNAVSKIGADIGSDHDLVMMTFQVRLKMARKPNQPRLRFDLEKLRNPDVALFKQR